ncbi:hypothetical protein J4422_04240 [Candidatus Pacearchaeota archaeon]|nr:hypothetical protein [Candidatus Pacearchaeota archaeon]
MKRTNDLSVAIMNFNNESNVGGLIRTANAAGLKEVVIVGRKKWNIGAATGAQSLTKIVRMPTTEEFLYYCKDGGYNLVSVEIGEDSSNIFYYSYPENPILVIGNEGTGVPLRILEASKGIVYIPQFGEVECLNAATSGSIAIYDWIRKNNALEEKYKIIISF